jgi:hypothetical protein
MAISVLVVVLVCLLALLIIVLILARFASLLTEEDEAGRRLNAARRPTLAGRIMEPDRGSPAR